MAFNYWTREIVILKEGEEICRLCNGYGVVPSSVLKNRKTLCEQCKGHGKVDWVERAVGKKDVAIGSIVF